MWIYDLAAAFIAVIAAMVIGIVALRRQYRVKHPPPTLEEKISFYEALNERLRKETEG